MYFLNFIPVLDLWLSDQWPAHYHTCCRRQILCLYPFLQKPCWPQRRLKVLQEFLSEKGPTHLPVFCGTRRQIVLLPCITSLSTEIHTRGRRLARLISNPSSDCGGNPLAVQTEAVIQYIHPWIIKINSPKRTVSIIPPPNTDDSEPDIHPPDLHQYRSWLPPQSDPRGGHSPFHYLLHSTWCCRCCRCYLAGFGCCQVYQAKYSATVNYCPWNSY